MNSIIFLILGALLIYFGITQAGFLLVWLGISFFITGLGHLWIGPLIYGKNVTGQLPLWSKIIHWPFLLYALFVWHILRYFSKEHPHDQITENIIIGRRLLKTECPTGIINYVDLTAEFIEPKSIVENMNYIALPILDAGIPSIEELNLALNKVTEQTTYIHCAQGHGRTAIFTIILLVTTGKTQNFEDAFSLIKKIRPAINLNSTQKKFVQEYLKNIV